MFDGLLFPLLALSALIWFVTGSPNNYALEILRDTFRQPIWNDILGAGLTGLRIALILGIDAFIVRRVWLAVKKPLVGSPPDSRRREEAQTTEKKLAWWPPLLAMSKSREIAAHMTKDEYSAAMKFGWWFGIWNAATFFLPFTIIEFTPIPLPMNWIIASVVLMTGLAFYPLWFNRQARFLCSTTWAKQRGVEPASLRMPALVNTGMILLAQPSC